MAKSMKMVRRVMLNTLTDGAEGLQVPLSTSMVKVITLLALQPMVTDMDVPEVMAKTNVEVVEMKYAYLEIYYDSPIFMAAYLLFFFFLGLVFHQEDAW